MDLKEDAILGIVESMIGPVSLPDATRELILSKASGNPFFVGEVVHALMDSGVFQQDPTGNWEYVETEVAVELPDTIHGIVISRIDRLDASDRRILQAASVLGRNFDYETLTNVYEGSNGIPTRLDSMQDLGLVEVLNRRSGEYRFIHLTTHEVVYESLSYGLRRDLHCQIGEFVEVTYADSISERINLLAYHFYQGHTWYKALSYNLQAGERAKTEFANDIAITSFEIVLEATDALSEEQDVSKEKESAHESLGEVLTLVGQYEEALEHYGSARGLVEIEPTSNDQIRHLADLSRKTAEVHERKSEYDIAFEWLGKGQDHLTGLEPTIEMANIYLLGLGIYRRQGRNDEAMEWCQKTLDIASRIKTREGQQAVAQAYYNLSGINWRRGDYEQAIDLCNTSAEIYQDIDDIAGLSFAHFNLSNAYADMGNWDQAIDHLRKSLEIKEKIGDVFYQAALANNLGEIYRDRGDWDLAVEQYKLAHDIWHRLGATLFVGLAQSNLGQVYIYQENWEQVKECLETSQALCEEADSDDYLAELDRRWGEFYLRTSDLEHAFSYAQRSVDLATEQEERLDMGLGFRVLGEVHMARGEFDDAEQALRQSLSLLDELGSEYEAAKTRLTLAQLAVDTAIDFDAEELQKAIEIFERLGARVGFERANKVANQL
jgi:tetratricopeptide (TPR) repeat protein